MSDELTTADGFELLSAESKDRGDVTDSVSVDRWSNYGKDRLYLNGLKTGDGWISLKTDEAGGERWTKVDARYELDGDELTIEVYKGYKVYYTIVVRVRGEGFESTPEPREMADDLEPCVEERHACEECGDEFASEHGVAVHAGLVHADDSEETQAMADGGEETIATDQEIEDAIEQHDDPAHEESLDVAEVREVLAWLQRSATEHWGEWLDNIQRRDATVVYDDSDVIVLETGEDNVPDRDLDYYDGDVEVDEIARAVITQVHHTVAERLTDNNWGYVYPFVIVKPDGVEDGQAYVEAIINGMLSEGLSPAEAWAYYGVEIRDNSQSAWAGRGDKDQSTISASVKRAKQKLPL